MKCFREFIFDMVRYIPDKIKNLINFYLSIDYDSDTFNNANRYYAIIEI